MTDFRTPRKRATGLGAAHHGAGHWLSERVSSLILVPLCVWAAFAALDLAGQNYNGAVTWLHEPLNAVLSVLLVAVGFWHMHTGLRVVIEDYLHGAAKITAFVANLFVCGLGGALGVFCLLKVALTGGAY